MIKELNHKDEATANEILRIQKPAYLAEAKLIRFFQIPRLFDTLETITTSSESFIGYYVQNELAGILSYEGNTICRLAVCPNYVRQRIGWKLVEYIVAKKGTQTNLKVSTGSQNKPAKELYRRFHFQEVGEAEIAPNVFLTFMERQKSR
ncbi:GNAT family N-acetyltransferase [Priestia megaterium]|nr:GNAT family N-acetyltransferase [Priestia megaterium]